MKKKEQEFIESVGEFDFKFEGDKHSIDAECFAYQISQNIELLKASANALYPQAFLRLEIKANKEGSFHSLLDVVVKHAKDLFTVDNTAIAGNIIQGYFNILQIKEHLKGKKAKKIEKKDDITAIENQEGEVLKTPTPIANDFFKDAKLENCVINIVSNLQANNIDGFSVGSGKEKKTEIKKEQYAELQERVIDEKVKTATTHINEPFKVDLLLKKPDLLGDSTWQFIFDKTINAKIEDAEFLQKVHNREIKTLYAGVKIPCMMRLEYDLDEKLSPVGNTRYIITKIVGDIIEPKEEESGSLFD